MAPSPQSALSLEHVGTPCVDGAPLTAEDVARIGAAAQAQRAALRGAMYAIASSSRDAIECERFLEMLGIDLDAARRLRDAI